VIAASTRRRTLDLGTSGLAVKGSGHWLMEEAPDQVIPALVAFLNK
jgi:pimeloyl-ACP methyl ester carboxylesterase